MSTDLPVTIPVVSALCVILDGTLGIKTQIVLRENTFVLKALKVLLTCERYLLRSSRSFTLKFMRTFTVLITYSWNTVKYNNFPKVTCNFTKRLSSSWTCSKKILTPSEWLVKRIFSRILTGVPGPKRFHSALAWNLPSRCVKCSAFHKFGDCANPYVAPCLSMHWGWLHPANFCNCPRFSKTKSL